MECYSPQERQFILLLARAIVAAIADDELTMFDDLAAEYFENPSPPERPAELIDDPLGAGFAHSFAFVSTAAAAIASSMLRYVQRAASGDSVLSSANLQTLIRDGRQRAEMRQQIREVAREYGMAPRTAEQITAETIAILGELAGGVLPSPRVINAWLLEQPLGAALQPDQIYHLCFNVGPRNPDALATAEGVDDLTATLLPEQVAVELLILVESEDFTVLGKTTQTLRVPSVGPSETVQFALQPARTGAGIIRVFFIINDQVFQKMRLELPVGAAPELGSQPVIRISGLPYESVAQRPKTQPSLSLIIEQYGARYKLMLLGSGRRLTAYVNISQTQVAELIREARDLLRDNIVHFEVGRQKIYQQPDTSIPAAELARALPLLAEMGQRLYSKLFYSGGSRDARAMGDILRSLMATEQFEIIVMAERFVFPWALLYTCEETDAVDVEGFWGFRHLITCIPEGDSADLIQYTRWLDVERQLQIGFVYNADMDREDGVQQPIVREQLDFFRSLPDVSVAEYAKREQLFALLGDPESPHHIIYLYCHAVSYLPDDLDTFGPRSVAQSYISLTDGPITLRELELHTKIMCRPFKRAPLIFLNACESAELSPYLYDGLVPYLFARGARSVLGSEVDTPRYFAAEFAQELIRRLNLGTSSLGQILLDMRQWYLFEKRNPLGLIYTLYGGNLIVRRMEQ